MTVQVKFLSAFFRKTDIAAHYPGGCRAFESEQCLGVGDADLYCLVAMSGGDLESALEAVGIGLGDLHVPSVDKKRCRAWCGRRDSNPHNIAVART